VTGVAHARVPAYLNAMDILCAPSQTTTHWREQLGRMLIEAFACGVPVLASDSGEIPFVVKDSGLIAREAEVSDWAQAILRLLLDDGLRADLAARGLSRAHEEYRWSKVARSHLDFMEELLETSRDI
jgi:glycosyltransferase involved in cell wall biosynthesis